MGLVLQGTVEMVERVEPGARALAVMAGQAVVVVQASVRVLADPAGQGAQGQPAVPARLAAAERLRGAVPPGRLARPERTAALRAAPTGPREPMETRAKGGSP